MNKLEELTDKAHQDFEARHQIRESALKLTRLLTRNAAHAIRAIHRGAVDTAEANMGEAGEVVGGVRKTGKGCQNELSHNHNCRKPGTGS